jgi:hypothetical protein
MRALLGTKRIERPGDGPSLDAWAHARAIEGHEDEGVVPGLDGQGLVEARQHGSSGPAVARADSGPPEVGGDQDRPRCLPGQSAHDDPHPRVLLDQIFAANLHEELAQRGAARRRIRRGVLENRPEIGGLDADPH